MTSRTRGRWAGVATTWGAPDDEDTEPDRVRTGHRASTPLALLAAAAAEAAIRRTRD